MMRRCVVVFLVIVLVIAAWTFPTRKIDYEHEQEHDCEEAIESMLPS